MLVREVKSMKEVRTSKDCMYNGADSDEPTAIMDRMACASSSDSENCSGATTILSPRGSYTFFIVEKDDFDTNTLTEGTHMSAIFEQPIHAASQGRAPSPPSLRL